MSRSDGDVTSAVKIIIKFILMFFGFGWLISLSSAWCFVAFFLYPPPAVHCAMIGDEPWCTENEVILAMPVYLMITGAGLALLLTLWALYAKFSFGYIRKNLLQ